jgi:hypothetical protein
MEGAAMISQWVWLRVSIGVLRQQPFRLGDRKQPVIGTYKGEWRPSSLNQVSVGQPGAC